ncbi:MAG: DUF58 domain-containing protein [Planctomycetes bacterium]|nr:DUF58 domain-containing protein [Planctomycetota bacterium]
MSELEPATSRTPNALLALPSSEARRRVQWLVRAARRLPLAAHDPRPSRRRPLQEGGLFREHRAYVAGDEARSVDWHVYARRRELVVKRTEPDERARFGLVLDLSSSVATSGEERTHLHRLLALALGSVALAQGHGVVLFALGPQGVETQAFEDAAALELFARACASAPSGGRGSLADIARASERLSRRPKSWIAISDFHPLDELERFLEGASRGACRLVHPTAKRDFAPLRRGLRRIADAERGGARWVLVTRGVAARYAELVRAHRERLSRIARERGAAAFEVDEGEPFELAAARILRGAVHRGGSA